MPGCHDLNETVIHCTKCPRLVSYREGVKISEVRYAGQHFWRKPVPGFGDLNGRLMIVGLAPAASGGNRTGRVFTGDRSAQFLVSALYEVGFASQPTSESADDGLSYSGTYVTAAVKCVPPDNRPSHDELENCLGYLGQEISCMPQLCAILTLGQFAYGAVASLFRKMGTKAVFPQFENRKAVDLQGLRIFMSYHPSPRNVNTGKLKRDDFVGFLYEIKQYMESKCSSTNNNL